MTVHPVAALFPMMSEEELDDLAADIQAHGQRDPIVYDKDGQLLDGRNRKEACRRIGLKPVSETLSDNIDPVAYILSKNVTRRHLSAGQRAMVTAKALLVSNTSQSEAARQSGVNRTRIVQAAVVLEHAPELADAVLAGAQPLDQAYTEARRRKLERESREEAEQREHQEREEAARRAAQELAALRSEAPDLADLVVEERLALGDAQAAWRRRQEEDRSERRALSQDIAAALLSFDGSAQIPVEERARHLLRVDASLVNGYPADFSVERVRKVIAVLSEWVTLREEHTTDGSESRATQRSE